MPDQKPNLTAAQQRREGKLMLFDTLQRSTTKSGGLLYRCRRLRYLPSLRFRKDNPDVAVMLKQVLHGP